MGKIRMGLVLIFLIISTLFPYAAGQTVSPIILSNVELVTVDESSASITWVTNLQANTEVQWGKTVDLGEEIIVDESELYHIAWISGLDDNTEYYYRIGSGGRFSDISSFTTLPEPEGEFKLKVAIISDAHIDDDGRNSADGSMNEEGPRLLGSAITELNRDPSIDFVVFLGDNTNGARADHEAFGAEINNLKAPYYPVIGNTDKGDENWADYYYSSTGWSETYYSFDMSGYHFVVLDSAVGGDPTGVIDDDQFDWLEADLDENKDTPTLIFMHHLADRTDIYGLDDDSKAKLDSILDAHPLAFSLTAGHIHKNIVNWDEETGRVYISTASLIQYPIGYNILKFYSDGYTQSYYKVESELAASEESRIRINTGTSGPNADEEYLGTIDDRSIILELFDNEPPIISSVSATSKLIEPGGSTTITVLAYDPEGSTLEYIYETTGGTISGTGPIVTYLAPQDLGTYTVTVKANDGVYQSDPMSIDIDVDPYGANIAPMISSVWTSTKQVMVKGVVSIEVSASDDDGDKLIYHYDPTGGTISGTGSKVEWQAPDKTGTYKIDVWVSDGVLKSKIETVTITVEKSNEKAGNGFLPGFEFGLIIIALSILLVWFRMGKREKN